MPFINKLGGAAPGRETRGGQIWTFGRSNANGAMMDGTTSNRSSPANLLFENHR